MDMDTEACNVSKQGLSVLQHLNKKKRRQGNGINILTNSTKRAWWKNKLSSDDDMSSGQKLCRAQLKQIRHAKSHWHSLERASMEKLWITRSSVYESKKKKRKKNPLCPLTPQLSCNLSPPGMKGLWAAWEGDSRLEVRVTTGLIRVTCQGRNPSAHAGQWLPS